jgi:hypothetical protein
VSAQRPRARSEVQRGGAGHAAQRPGPAYFDALGPEHPSFPGAGYLDAIGPEHPSFPGAGGDLRTLGPADSGPLGMAYYAPSAYAPPAPPRVSPPGSPGHGARFPVPPPRGRHAAQQVVELDQPAPQAQPAAAPRTSDSARLAQRMLAEADEQAARIITTAQQRAIEIGQSAAEKAAATREAAERETAELRTAVEDMTGELRRVAVDVVENLATPVKRATRPAARTTASPAARPAGETLAQSASGLAEQSMAAAAPAADPVVPGAMPRARPRRDADAGSARTAVKPGVSPRRAAKPRPAAGGQSRQARAWRRMVGALAILAVLGLGTAGVEVGLHGFSFFLFRNTGAGAGNSHDFEEDQGPGQSHAPGTHHDVRRSPSHGPSGKPR